MVSWLCRPNIDHGPKESQLVAKPEDMPSPRALKKVLLGDEKEEEGIGGGFMESSGVYGPQPVLGFGCTFYFQ